MKMQQVNDWLQVIATIGVVVGLLLVVMELRESSKAAREQGISAMSGAYSKVGYFGNERAVYNGLDFESPWARFLAQYAEPLHAGVRSSSRPRDGRAS